MRQLICTILALVFLAACDEGAFRFNPTPKPPTDAGATEKCTVVSDGGYRVIGPCCTLEEAPK
jgi:hypothetical protein